MGTARKSEIDIGDEEFIIDRTEADPEMLEELRILINRDDRE